MTRVNVADAKAKLSAYLKLVEQGQTVVICRRNVPVAQLRPIVPERTGRRPVGIDRGMQIPDSFFEPLPTELLEAFAGKSGDK